MSRARLKLKRPITEFELDVDENSVQFLWIPVTEQLPEIDQEVLVYLFKDSPYIAWHDGKYWCTEEFCLDEDECPTHWMSLPEPPKKNES